MVAAVAATGLVFAAGGKESAAKNEKEVLEFYHGYFHSKEEWAPAAVYREIYEEFAKKHAGGNVTFKQIPVENWEELQNAKIAQGSSLIMLPIAVPAISTAAVLAAFLSKPLAAVP